MLNEHCPVDLMPVKFKKVLGRLESNSVAPMVGFDRFLFKLIESRRSNNNDDYLGLQKTSNNTSTPSMPAPIIGLPLLLQA
jgi:hypothetical protein